MEPQLQNMFSEFKELKRSELAGTRELHGHTERVMRAVENSVNAMDDPDSLSAYLRELGRRHLFRSAKPSVRHVSSNIGCYNVQQPLIETESFLLNTKLNSHNAGLSSFTLRVNHCLIRCGFSSESLLFPE